MEKILKERGYKLEDNLWSKADWTIRFDKDTIEVFNNPDKAAGYYHTAPIKKIDIEILLDEIDDFILD